MEHEIDGFSSEAILEEAIAIARIPAPTGMEDERAVAVEQAVRAIGGWQASRDEVGNVIVRPEHRGGGSEPSTWVLTHLDTVFAADTPLVFHRRADTVTGPGIGDNAVAIAATLAILRRLREHDGAASRTGFAFTVGEEAEGNLHGARAMLAGPAASAKTVLAVEGHRGDELGTVMVGSSRYAVSATRPGGHSWWDRGTPSAIHDVMEFCWQVREAAAADRELAFNIGTIVGGTGITAIAAQASARFEARSAVDESLASFEKLVAATVASQPRPLLLEALGRRPAGSMPADHPLVIAAQEVRRRRGLDPAPSGSTSSDANPFVHAGIPALTIGLTTGSNAHQPDESIDVSPIALGTALLFDLLLILAADGG